MTINTMYKRDRSIMGSLRLKPLKHNYNIVMWNNDQILFSYETPVAIIEGQGNIYRTKQYYSSTTTRHINKFLSGLKYETVDQDKIDNYLNK